MEYIAPERLTDLDFWESNAPWYALWLRHNNYHGPIKNILAARVRPDWRVLDIGGGTGVLTFFLLSLGCRPVLLEPARAMRDFFAPRAAGESIGGLAIESRRWEDMPLCQLDGFDLILACNSLHVASVGFEAALNKVFAAGPRHVCLVAEEPHAAGLDGRDWPGYGLVHSDAREIASSHAYHSPEEALDHAAFRKGGRLTENERNRALAGLVFENGHYWRKETARLRWEWWTRMEETVEEKIQWE